MSSRAHHRSVRLDENGVHHDSYEGNEQEAGSPSGSSRSRSESDSENEYEAWYHDDEAR